MARPTWLGLSAEKTIRADKPLKRDGHRMGRPAFGNTSGMGEYRKVYVGMTLFVDASGKIRPAAVHWEDGRRFGIDRVVSLRTASPDHVGGVLTDRYEVSIEGRPRVLYRERQTGRWFLEQEID